MHRQFFWSRLAIGWCALLVVMGSSGVIHQAWGANPVEAEHVILIVLEGVTNDVIHAEQMPVLNRLAQEGASSQTATTVSPAFAVPAMASVLTGLSIDRHKVTKEWERYDFARSFVRAPTVFDYMDLAGGKDSAVFFMDERFYQLARPEIYVDSQTCGTSRPECTPARVVVYIRDYLTKVTGEGGHGFRLFTIPDLLLVHLPSAARVGRKSGWSSKQYGDALGGVDVAVGEILATYKDYEALDQTMVVVIGLTSESKILPGKNGKDRDDTVGQLAVPWIAWGANVKPGYHIKQSLSILDTGATILRALGLETHTEWESQPVDEIFITIPKVRPIER